jgi:methylmalonyl-CoA/ethylmalonyl-CoA epimerase
LFQLIDHVGVAVSDLEQAVALYEDTFEMPVVHRETVESQGVEAMLLEVGDGHVELLRPLGPETVVGRFIAKRGEGLHHVAYRVEDIDATLATLKESGVELIDAEARVGIWGSRVAFVHPKATGGALTELVEPVEGDWRRRGGGR